MSAVPLRCYWPYDEVTTKGDCSSGCFTFSTPWMELEIEVEQKDKSRVGRLLEKLSSQALVPEDLPQITSLFAPISHHALSYVLPQPEIHPEKDQHDCVDYEFIDLSPVLMLSKVAKQLDTYPDAFDRIIQQNQAPSEWHWDIEAALSFSKVSTSRRSQPGHDPITLFTVARRFHLLESVEKNKTGDLYQFLRELKSDPETIRYFLARLVRQNHHVTLKCDSTLKPALQIAKNAQGKLQKFMRAEAGHEVFLERALRSMGIVDIESVQVLDTVIALMEVFKWVAQRNFLAFSMVVDMFERSSYLEQDPLASILDFHGFSEAAKQIDLHREINDLGEHENMGVSFLETMGEVDSRYAWEALRIAELVTDLLHRLSASLLEEFKGTQSLCE